MKIFWRNNKEWDNEKTIPLFPRTKASIFQRIKWKLNGAYYWIRNLRHRINNLIKWFPIIFYDFDFDYMYLFKIMRFKIGEMRKHQEECQNFIGWEKIVKQMKHVEMLMDRFSEDNYQELALKKHEEKWGETQYDLLPTKNNTRQLDIYSPIAREKGLEKQEREEYRNILDEERNLKDYDFKTIFYILGLVLRSWWD